MSREVENKRQSFEAGAVVLLVSTLLVKVIGAVFKIPLSNLLGDTGTGYFASSYDLFMPFYAMAMSGIPVASARMISSFAAENDYKSIVLLRIVKRRIMRILAAVGFTLFLLLIFPMSGMTSSDRSTVYGLIAVAPSIPLFCVMSYYRGLYEGFENMTPTAVSDLLEALGKLILGYSFAFITLKLTNDLVLAAAAALFGITVGVAIAVIYLSVKFRKDKAAMPLGGTYEFTAEQKKEFSRDFIRLLLPITVSAVTVSVFASFTDVLTVKSCLEKAGIENAISLYGIRSKAFTLFNLVPSLTMAIGVSVVPTLAAAVEKKDAALLSSRAEELLKLTAVVAFPAGFGLTFLARHIMELIYTSSVAGSLGASLLRVYGITAVLAGIAVPLINALQAIGRQKKVLAVLLGGVAIKLVLNIVLVSQPEIGIMGAAIATLCAYAAVFAAAFCMFVHYTRAKGTFMLLLKPAACALVCPAAGVISMLFDSKSMTVLLIGAAAAVYFILIFALKTFTADELEGLKGSKKH